MAYALLKLLPLKRCFFGRPLGILPVRKPLNICRTLALPVFEESKAVYRTKRCCFGGKYFRIKFSMQLPPEKQEHGWVISCKLTPARKAVWPRLSTTCEHCLSPELEASNAPQIAECSLLLKNYSRVSAAWRWRYVATWLRLLRMQMKREARIKVENCSYLT